MKNTRKKIVWLMAWVMVALMYGPVSAGGEIKLALDCPPDPNKCGTYLWATSFEAEAKAGGLSIKLYPRDALGGEDEKLDQVSQGLLEISCSDTAKAASIDETIFGFHLPFLWENQEHAYRVLKKSGVMDKVNGVTTKQGVRVLALVPLGGMGGFAVTRDTIKTPTDFKGVRMRAMNNQQVEMYKAWGSNSVVIPWSEIYNALQTGIADGYMNPPLVPIMFKHTELIKNFSVVNMSCGTRAIIASEDWYAGLSKKDRAVVDGAVAKASEAAWKWSIQVAEKSLQDLKDAGINVYRNTSAEKAQFAKLVRPVYAEIVPKKVADYFVEIADKHR